MRQVDTLAVVSGFLALLLLPSLAPGQTGQGVGIVSTIAGQATISRASMPKPLPLQFQGGFPLGGSSFTSLSLGLASSRFFILFAAQLLNLAPCP